jgi:DNA-binding response OmpR family regulator
MQRNKRLVSVAIVENEKREVEGSLEYLNFKYFQNAIEYQYFETSQDFLKSDVNGFSLIIIDIHLTKKSDLDGFGLIQRLIDSTPAIKDKLVILTGYYKVEEKLKEYNLPILPIVVKPTDFKELYKLFGEKGLSAQKTTAS